MDATIKIHYLPAVDGSVLFVTSTCTIFMPVSAIGCLSNRLLSHCLAQTATPIHYESQKYTIH